MMLVLWSLRRPKRTTRPLRPQVRDCFIGVCVDHEPPAMWQTPHKETCCWDHCYYWSSDGMELISLGADIEAEGKENSSPTQQAATEYAETQAAIESTMAKMAHYMQSTQAAAVRAADAQARVQKFLADKARPAFVAQTLTKPKTPAVLKHSQQCVVPHSSRQIKSGSTGNTSSTSTMHHALEQGLYPSMDTQPHTHLWHSFIQGSTRCTRAPRRSPWRTHCWPRPSGGPRWPLTSRPLHARRRQAARAPWPRQRPSAPPPCPGTSKFSTGRACKAQRADTEAE